MFFIIKCLYITERKPLDKTYPRHTLNQIGKSKSGGKDTFKESQINEDGSRSIKNIHETPHQLLEISKRIIAISVSIQRKNQLLLSI